MASDGLDNKWQGFDRSESIYISIYTNSVKLYKRSQQKPLALPPDIGFQRLQDCYGLLRNSIALAKLGGASTGTGAASSPYLWE
jgi:hypothetical protein